MKLPTFMQSFWIVFTVVVAFTLIRAMNAYMDVMVAYQERECSERAYLIYKGYDDQAEETQTQDWFSRIDKCATISSEFQMSKPKLLRL